MSSFTNQHSAIVKCGLANMCAIYDEILRKNTNLPKTGSELYEMMCLEIFGDHEPQCETQEEPISKSEVSEDDESKTGSTAIQSYNQKINGEESEVSESEEEEEDDGRFPDGWIDRFKSDSESDEEDEVFEESEDEVFEESEDEESEDEKINDEKINDEKINDEKINDEEINDEKINDEEINDEKINDEKINDAPERKDVSIEHGEKKVSVEEIREAMKSGFSYKPENHKRSHRLHIPYLPDSIDYECNKSSVTYCQAICSNGGLYTPCLTRIGKNHKDQMYCSSCLKTSNPTSDRSQFKDKIIDYKTYLQKRDVPISFVKDWMYQHFGDRLTIDIEENPHEEKTHEEKTHEKNIKKNKKHSNEIVTSSDDDSELELESYESQYSINKTIGDYQYLTLKNEKEQTIEFSFYVKEISTNIYYGIDDCNQAYKNTSNKAPYFINDEDCGEFIGFWDPEKKCIIYED